jgi:hypothetical protein
MLWFPHKVAADGQKGFSLGTLSQHPPENAELRPVGLLLVFFG